MNDVLPIISNKSNFSNTFFHGICGIWSYGRYYHKCVKIDEASRHKGQVLVVEALVVIQQLNPYILDRTNVKLSEVQIRKRT